MAPDVVSVHPVSRNAWPKRVRVVGRARRWVWNGQLVLRCGIAGIPVGALTGILVGLFALRQPPTEALWSYGYGAGAGLVAGLALGAVLAALGAVVSWLRWSRPATGPRRLWVRHRPPGPVVTARR